jgi:ribonucleoside-diphosphate reductase alpha chain
MEYPGYDPTGFALEIFRSRYTIHDQETFSEACSRVAYHVAQAESGDSIIRCRGEFKDILEKNLFMPGGRIWYGSGRPKGNLLNCFATSVEDSREGWGKTTSDMIVISGNGGGVGTNYSPVRPRGTPIAGSGGTATGAVSLMHGINAFADVVKSGGGRRVALMMALDHNHGDIMEFLDAKLNRQQLNNANVSVVFSDNPETFFGLVKKDQDVELKFRGKVIGKINAKELWHKIVGNALKCGEPGVLNMYLANKMSNISYCSTLTTTNPCFAPGTMVQTKHGHFPIESLVGKSVEIWNGDSWQTVDNFRITGRNQDMLKIEFYGGSFERVTLNHTVILSDGVRIKAQDVFPGMQIAISKAPSSYENLEILGRWSNVVKSVEMDGVEPLVYCCTVEGNHSLGLSSGLLWGQCGEIPMSPYESCCLGSLVLPRFVDEQKGDLDWAEIKKTVTLGVRFLDDVLTVNSYPLPEIKATVNNLRRLGLGVMGLHDVLLMLGMKYNSPEGLELVDKLLCRIKNWSYEASIALAEEKGSFPKFEADLFIRSGFVKTLKPSLREKIRTNGIRNCALLTIAPTGTTSMVCCVSSGIEPMFAAAYNRKFMDGDNMAEEVVIHPLFKRFVNEGKSVSHFQGAHEISMRDHLEMQRTCQRHLDNSSAKTVNVPQGTSEEELSDLFMEFLPEIKGVTVYPDGSRENQPLTPIPLHEAIAKCQSAKVETTEGRCRSGVCQL